MKEVISHIIAMMIGGTLGVFLMAVIIGGKKDE